MADEVVGGLVGVGAGPPRVWADLRAHRRSRPRRFGVPIPCKRFARGAGARAGAAAATSAASSSSSRSCRRPAGAEGIRGGATRLSQRRACAARSPPLLALPVRRRAREVTNRRRRRHCKHKTGPRRGLWGEGPSTLSRVGSFTSAKVEAETDPRGDGFPSAPRAPGPSPVLGP